MNEEYRFRSYSGEEFLATKFQKREWLIENILREKDTLLFVGDKKAGKSLFIQQMICSLTTQHSFLDKYEVKRTARVTYVQLEGEIEDTKDRLLRLMKNVEFDPALFQIIYYPAINLSQIENAKQLVKDIVACHKPDIVIVDPVYCALAGSLSDDEAVRAFIASIRWLKNYLNCGIILVHHTHKLRMTRDGVIMTEGDDAAFGSVFLAAYADQLLLFVYNKKTGQRILSCDTQRSGDIEQMVKLNLIQPDPLYFEETTPTTKPVQNVDIYELLRTHPEGMTREQIIQALKISSPTFYRALKGLADRLIREGRPTIYKIKEVKECPKSEAK